MSEESMSKTCDANLLGVVQLVVAHWALPGRLVCTDVVHAPETRSMSNTIPPTKSETIDPLSGWLV